MKLPTCEVMSLADNITIRPHQIVSKKLAHQDDVHVSLFSFDGAESVSEQANSEDIFIFVLEGTVAVETPSHYQATSGQVLAIPHGTLHRVHSVTPSKIFQYSTNKGEPPMEQFIKKVNQREILDLAAALDYEEGGISSLAMVQRNSLTITLMAFDADERIASHSSNGDALVQVLEGTAAIDIDGTPYTIPAGKSIIMPALTPHAVAAAHGQFKMMLTVVKPQ